MVNNVLVTDPTMRQPGFDVPHGRFRSSLLSLQPTQMGSRLMCVASSKPLIIWSTCVHSLCLVADCIPYMKPVMMQSTGWSLMKVGTNLEQDALVEKTVFFGGHDKVVRLVLVVDNVLKINASR